MHVTDNRHRLGSACGVRRRSQQAIPASPKLHCHRRAEVQFGLIHRSQALAEGMTERMVDWCLLTGDWFVSLPGVYALRGSTPCWLRDEMGAVLWAGPYAAASGRAAGALWGLDGIDADVVEVSTNSRVRRSGIVVHRTQDLGTIKRKKGIPVTDQYRTLIDLAGLVDPPLLEAALDSGLRRRLVHIPLVREEIARSAKRRGIAQLKMLLNEREAATNLTRSTLEALLSDFIRTHGIPPGRRNYDLILDGTFIACLDVAWPELKVGIEVDSRRHHMGHAAWERDAARYSKVVSFDWRILTVTSGQLRRKSEEFAAQVLRLVGQRSLDL